MSHIPDMKALGNRMVSIGWLHPDHPFPRGAAPPEFVARLIEFSRNWDRSIEALGWGAAGGFHGCEFCIRRADRPSMFPADGSRPTGLRRDRGPST
jgi:hypothetical protein